MKNYKARYFQSKKDAYSFYYLVNLLYHIDILSRHRQPCIERVQVTITSLNYLYYVGFEFKDSERYEHY